MGQGGQVLRREGGLMRLGRALASLWWQWYARRRGLRAAPVGARRSRRPRRDQSRRSRCVPIAVHCRRPSNRRNAVPHPAASHRSVSQGARPRRARAAMGGRAARSNRKSLQWDKIVRLYYGAVMAMTQTNHARGVGCARLGRSLGWHHERPLVESFRSTKRHRVVTPHRCVGRLEQFG
jgi:hypothetical protein